MGIICRSKHVGVHELRVKVGSCFVKMQEGRRASWPRASQTMCRIDSKQAHCPQRFTTCRLTCLPSRLALAGSYPRVPEVRSNWLTKGGLVESVVYPEIELRIGEPVRAAVDPVADIDVDRRP